MTNPTTVRPLTADEIAQIASKYALTGVAAEMIRETRAIYPDATGLAYNWENEYDDEGGYTPSTGSIYVLFGKKKYIAVFWEDLEDQDDNVVPLPQGFEDVDALRDALIFGIARVRGLKEAKSGPGELNFDFAQLEKEYLTELPTLYVAVAQ